MQGKIKVVFTGGTIGSLSEGNNISPNDNAKFLLLQKYKEKTGCDVGQFETIQPLSILSEDAVLPDVLQMANIISKAQFENIRGIIITHGSDTLAFSSAYLSFLLPNLKVPVVLVASNLILTDPKANGVDNFVAAVNLINSQVQSNIYVAYKNSEDDYISIHLGTRMAEPPPYSDNFYSPQGKRFAICKDGEIFFENTIIKKSKKVFVLSNNFSKKCLYIPAHTGLNYDVYRTADFDFVLHNLYHSGTANTRKEYPLNNFLNFAEFCKKNKKPVYLCNIKQKDVNYDSTNQMKKNDISFLYDILPNVALAKLNIAFNLIDESERIEYLKTCINGEILQDCEK